MSKILDQEEVDTLLRGLSGPESEIERRRADADSSIMPFDLVNQDCVLRGHMPALEIINDRFSRLCTNALGRAMRKHVHLNPLCLDMLRFGDFIRFLPVPSSINIFKMGPLRGSSLLVMDSRLVFALVDNFFGGTGTRPKVEGRDFTAIEQAIVDRVVKIVLNNMEQAWQPVHKVQTELVRSETNPQFAVIVPPSDVVVVIRFEVELENVIGSLTVCLPYAILEPIRSKLDAFSQSERLEADHVWLARFKDYLLQTPVEMVIELGQTQITGRQVLNLDVGDILLLDTATEDLLPAEVSGVQKFYGLPATVKGSKAFQVVRKKETHFP